MYAQDNARGGVWQPPSASLLLHVRAPRFGNSYSASCYVGLAKQAGLADYSSSGPRLYDPYLVQDDGSLYPIPVRVTNRPSVGGQGQVWGLMCARVACVHVTCMHLCACMHTPCLCLSCVCLCVRVFVCEHARMCVFKQALPCT